MYIFLCSSLTLHPSNMCLKNGNVKRNLKSIPFSFTCKWIVQEFLIFFVYTHQTFFLLLCWEDMWERERLEDLSVYLNIMVCMYVSLKIYNYLFMQHFYYFWIILVYAFFVLALFLYSYGNSLLALSLWKNISLFWFNNKKN